MIELGPVAKERSAGRAQPPDEQYVGRTMQSYRLAAPCIVPRDLFR